MRDAIRGCSIGALMIRIGLWGRVDYTFSREPWGMALLVLRASSLSSAPSESWVKQNS